MLKELKKTMPKELKYENDISPNKEYTKINRNYKRNKIEIIKFFWKSLEGLKSSTGWVEEKICDLEEKLFEITQSEEKKKKEWRKINRHQRCIRQQVYQLIYNGVPEEEERKEQEKN